jgi:hypothetical protein
VATAHLDRQELQAQTAVSKRSPTNIAEETSRLTPAAMEYRGPASNWPPMSSSIRHYIERAASAGSSKTVMTAAVAPIFRSVFR